MLKKIVNKFLGQKIKAVTAGAHFPNSMQNQPKSYGS